MHACSCNCSQSLKVDIGRFARRADAAAASANRGQARRLGQSAARAAGHEARTGLASPVSRVAQHRGRGSWPLWLGQQPGGPKRSQKARGGAHCGVVLAAMQSAQGRGVGQAVEHNAASMRRGKDDRGRLARVWWGRGELNDAVAILDAPHGLFDPLHNALDAQSDGSRASCSTFLVGGPATRLRAPQAWPTPADSRGQLGPTARADRPVRHGDTLP